jgi:hypothetical protein
LLRICRDYSARYRADYETTETKLELGKIPDGASDHLPGGPDYANFTDDLTQEGRDG